MKRTLKWLFIISISCFGCNYNVDSSGSSSKISSVSETTVKQSQAHLIQSLIFIFLWKM